MCKVKINSLTAGFALAMAFIFSCSIKEEEINEDNPSSSSYGNSSSSSVGGESSSSVDGGISSSSNILTDSRDNRTYKTVIIGEQTWMAENLNYDVEGSKCYDDKPYYCDFDIDIGTGGRLYNWATAMSICPSGWHIPSYDDWDELFRWVDEDNGVNEDYDHGSYTAGKYLKASIGWSNYNGASGSGTDKYGFAALPSGYGNFITMPFGFGSSYVFHDAGESGNWWSSTSIELYAYYMSMNYNDELAYLTDEEKSKLFSVRCVQD